MLSYDRGTLSVNLLLNRASPWADVHSHIPYVGRVDVDVKKQCDLRIRIPEWARPDDVSCSINSVEHPINFDGRYALIGKVHAKDAVSVSFPIAERIAKLDIEKHQYMVIARGNDVVRIEPPGKHCPLYLREHYRQDSTRWRKMERFVSNEAIQW